MKLPFELFLALRYLRPKRTFVSIITLISVLGVTVGVWVLIVVICVMSGFDKDLREKILGFNPHMRVTPKNSAMYDFETVREKIVGHPDVKAVAPFVFGPLLIQTQPASGDPLTGVPFVKGVDPELEKSVSILHTNIVEGTYDLSGSSILVGWEMARDLRLSVGDKISIQSQASINQMLRTRNSEDAEVHLPDEYEVKGVFDVGYYQYNSGFLITSLENAQELYNLEEAVHGLIVMLKDPFQASVVRDRLQPLLEDYDISIWTEEHSSILNALMVEKSVMFYILFFIMIVAAFGIMNSLITFVVQKTHDIGMLKALGTTRSQIVKLFLGQSLIVGVLGVLIGLGAGLLSLAYRNNFLKIMNKLTGFELFPADIYGFRNLPAVVMPGDIAWICGSALVICILAGILPAYIAARMQPVEALRYD